MPPRVKWPHSPRSSPRAADGGRLYGGWAGGLKRGGYYDDYFGQRQAFEVSRP